MMPLSHNLCKKGSMNSYHETQQSKRIVIRLWENYSFLPPVIRGPTRGRISVDRNRERIEVFSPWKKQDRPEKAVELLRQNQHFNLHIGFYSHIHLKIVKIHLRSVWRKMKIRANSFRWSEEPGELVSPERSLTSPNRASLTFAPG